MVEGLIIVQNYDRNDDSARFREFREAYFRRFQKNPGYSSVSAYDAALVLFAALEKRADSETVKAAVLKHGPYQACSSRSASTPRATPSARSSLPKSV